MDNILGSSYRLLVGGTTLARGVSLVGAQTTSPPPRPEQQVRRVAITPVGCSV